MSISFDELALHPRLLKAIKLQGYTTPTPIQAQAIPYLMAGRDVLGCAQTGTGKTAAFSLPILHRLQKTSSPGKRRIKALILSPTRELALQIDENIELYGQFLDLEHLCIYGGVSQVPQAQKLRRGVDVLVATPGRLLDLQGQGVVDLGHVDVVVLDEADRMLDMGFIHDMRRVFRLLPKDRQSLLFSATMPDDIAKLAADFLSNPVRVEVDRESSTVTKIHQRVMFVERSNKKKLLANLLKDPEVESAIVFTRTKHGANRVAQILSREGITAAAIHGNKSQGARQRALAGFKAGEIRALIATDIASRGIDVDGVSHVFNYELPNIPESYVHRIGRTGRAGRDGIAVAFCDETETAYLLDIEKLTGHSLEVLEDHEFHFPDAVPDPERQPTKSSRRRGGRNRGDSEQSLKQRHGSRGNRGQNRRPSTNGDGEANGRSRPEQKPPRPEKNDSKDTEAAKNSSSRRRRRPRRPSGTPRSNHPADSSSRPQGQRSRPRSPGGQKPS